MPYATYRFNKIIATETIRFIVTVAIVVYKGLKLVVYRMLTIYSMLTNQLQGDNIIKTGKSLIRAVHYRQPGLWCTLPLYTTASTQSELQHPRIGKPVGEG